MRLRLTLTGALLLLMLSTVQAQKQSVTFKSQYTNVQVKFPGEPKVTTEYIEQVRMEVATFKQGDLEFQLSTVVTFDPEDFAKEIEKVGGEEEAAIRTLLGKNSELNGQLTREQISDWKFKKRMAKKGKIASTYWDRECRVVILDEVVCILTVSGRDNPMGRSKFDQKKAEAFFKSFKTFKK